MSKTLRSAGVRFNHTTYLRWWQVRTIDFGLLLFALIVQRVLVLVLFIAATTVADQDSLEMSFALDATYAGIHAPTTLKHIIILGWILLGVAAVTAYLERCYRWPKTIVIFVGLFALMTLMTLNALAIYEPYLAIRR